MPMLKMEVVTETIVPLALGKGRGTQTIGNIVDHEITKMVDGAIGKLRTLTIEITSDEWDEMVNCAHTDVVRPKDY